ncbi:D-2-hydroxyacid dehydrogenase [Campylobacter sp. MIT 21-1685]|uniref:D-2-hydroxyacid dehydrogenase n=1 Tax=unclassified Campylobacter TaxID=2593542 RepID=UPI00224A80AE|nr:MULTISPECIES: D-2-hydroxyacid dehydrogenase [unclassified Campylobacter]MCX2683500.1 D-2-hydroxyacid dehydrogenase [Campylobacter sp. MIT 21-1684]MCX2751781.1 D-2-hydroxyacid dehydrogenase [Campylobacter sp. MIT 21-1682]MCX2807982.1 D-2-hydroxyacid dehydrogenase [Campylobacter sp. MIT 21-1685]
MKIVCLDAATLGNYDLSVFEKYGEFQSYKLTPQDEVIARLKDADVAMVNKIIIDKEVLESTTLKLILETATGLNNIDIEYAKAKGIIVKNVAAYSTMSVAQHTFALLFAFLNQIPFYDKWSKEGKWSNNPIFTDYTRIINTLAGKKHGIIGLGTIGKKVAELSQAFGAELFYYSTSGANMNADFIRLGLDELLQTCDIVSIHAPLNEKTKNLLNLEKLQLLKEKSVLINVGRGGIINEKDLAQVLDEKDLRVGLDVLEVEPMIPNHPLLNIKHKERLLITPHIAWASEESLQALMQKVEDNLKTWIENGK